MNTKVDALTHATLEKAREKAAALLGEDVTDAVLLRTLAGAFLETRQAGEEREGHAPFHVVFSADASGSLDVETADGPVTVDAATAELVLCDAGVARACHCKAPEPLPFGQDVPTPEALRRRVLARDGHRCVACRSTVNLHVHHVLFRSAGGPTVASNLATVCVRCHTLVHEDLLRIRGSAPHGLTITDRRGQVLERIDPAALRIERTGTSAPSRDGDPDLTLDRLPAEADTTWWRRHAHLFAWSDRKGTLELTPGQPLPADATGPALPPASAAPTLDALIGQDRVVRVLATAVEAARREDRAIVHTLLHGPAGCGKTTLA